MNTFKSSDNINTCEIIQIGKDDFYIDRVSMVLNNDTELIAIDLQNEIDHSCNLNYDNYPDSPREVLFYHHNNLKYKSCINYNEVKGVIK